MAGEIRDGAARGREAAEQSGEEDRVTEAEPPQQLPDRRVRPPDREAYDLAAAFDHKMVRQYEPDFLDKGGEHIVYRVPMAKDVVVKVDAHTLRGMQTRGAMHGLRPGEINLELFAALEEKLQKDRERFQRLRAAFGREHVPGLKQGLVRVPVTEKMLRALHGGRPPGEVSGVKESWAIVKVQRRAAEVGKDGTLSVTAGYAERDQADREDYVLATRAYVENDAAAVNEGAAEAFEAIARPELREVLDAAKEDPAAAEMLKDFVSKAIAYANSNGEILDLAGKGNVTFYKDGDKWNYRLIDALYGRERMIRDAVAAARAAADGKADEYGRNVLLNVVNFTRAINAMAERLGISERVSWLPEDAKGKIDFLTLLKR